MTVDDIISAVRPIIGDTKSTRWSDTRLLAITNEAQNELIKIIGYKIATGTIDLVAGTSEYTLPTTLFSLLRVTYNNDVVPFNTYNNMDDTSTKWELDRGPTPKYIIYDKANSNTIKVYPIPSNISVVGDLASSTSNDPNNPYGAALGYISDDSDETVIDGQLHLRYQCTLTELTATTSTIDLDAIYKAALTYYVVVAALNESTREQDITKSQMYLSKWQSEIALFRKTNSKNYVNNIALVTNYRTI